MTTKSDRNLSYEEATMAGLIPRPEGKTTSTYILTPPGASMSLDMSMLRKELIKTEAIKDDSGKVDWTLVPFEALEGMVQVLEFGAKKYSAWNWTTGGGFKWMRILASCLRHLFAFMRGEDNDPESGLSHISHAQCNLLFLAYYIRNKDKCTKDDRNAR